MVYVFKLRGEKEFFIADGSLLEIRFLFYVVNKIKVKSKFMILSSKLRLHLQRIISAKLLISFN